jgi:hypothetical protein
MLREDKSKQSGLAPGTRTGTVHCGLGTCDVAPAKACACVHTPIARQLIWHMSVGNPGSMKCDDRLPGLFLTWIGVSGLVFGHKSRLKSSGLVADSGQLSFPFIVANKATAGVDAVKIEIVCNLAPPYI